MGGVVFGIAGLYPALYVKGFWVMMCEVDGRNSCDLLDHDNRMTTPLRAATALFQLFGDTSEIASAVPDACCSSQVLQVGVVTSAAFAITDGSSAVWGEVVDRLGPRAGLSFALALVLLGQLFLATASFSEEEISDHLATGALFGVGAGGAGVTTAAFVGCTIAISASSPSLQAWLSTGLAATFDISAIVFPVVSVLFSTGIALHLIVILMWLPASATSGGFLLYLFAPSPQSGVMPKEDSSLLESDKAAAASAPAAPQPKRKCLEKGTQAATLLSAHNLMLLAFMCCYTMATTFHVSVYGLESKLRFGDTKAAKFDHVFSVGFPLSSVLGALLTAPLLRATNEKPHFYWGFAVALSAIWVLFTLIPLEAAQYFAAVLFGVARTVVWSAYYHFLASPAAYPPEMIGRVLGCNTLVVAFLGDLLSHGVERIAIRTPPELGPIMACRIWLLAQLLLCSALPAYLWRSGLTRRS
jgi:MFS family permease